MVEIDIEFVKSVAQEAGAFALERIEGATVEFKADNSYVTDIDRSIERFVQQRLSVRYPDFAFQGEEFGRYGGDGVPLWAVDPIDGTTNMVFGIPAWGVSIGLIDEGQAAAGALYLPRTGEMFWGRRGQGAFCNGVRLEASDRDTLHPEDTLGFTSSALKTLPVSKLTGRLRCLGSIATEVAYTARGSLCSHVGCYEGANDLTAALCLAHEAGCISTYLNGEPLDMATLVREGHTAGPFIIAPPRMAALLRSLLHS